MSAKEEQRPPAANPHLVAALAWLVPGAGHFYLRRRLTGVVFFLVVGGAATIGLLLHGNLWRVVRSEPLSIPATIASMGMGLAYFVLRFFTDYQGDLLAATYEYGSAFLLTAGLMNLLLILDAWDIAVGRKE